MVIFWRLRALDSDFPNFKKSLIKYSFSREKNTAVVKTIIILVSTEKSPPIADTMLSENCLSEVVEALRSELRPETSVDCTLLLSQGKSFRCSSKNAFAKSGSQVIFWIPAGRELLKTKFCTLTINELVQLIK